MADDWEIGEADPQKVPPWWGCRTADEVIDVLVETGALDEVENTAEQIDGRWHSVSTFRRVYGAPAPSVAVPPSPAEERDLLAEETENAACPVCGEDGPCGFTDDGEPLIHGAKRAADEMKRMIDEARDPEFMERLQTRMVEDGPLLDRLAATGPSLRDKTEPCGSTARAVLGAVDPEGAWLYCGLLRNHAGPHQFHMEWLVTETLPAAPTGTECATCHDRKRVMVIHRFAGPNEYRPCPDCAPSGASPTTKRED